MELNFTAKYKKIESFRIAAGVAALTAAGLWGVRFFWEVFSENWAYLGHLDFVSLIARLYYLLILPIAIAASMVLFAVYVFTRYGRDTEQKPLLGISAVVLAACFGMFSFIAFLSVAAYGFRSILFVVILPDLLLAGIFVFIALKFFNKIRCDIHVLPIIAIALSLFSTTLFLPLIWGFSFYGEMLLDTLFSLLYLAPFLLIILFCPITKINSLSANLLQQERNAGDLSAQLMFLKNKFDSGSISQREYDYTRKTLIDRL